MVGTAETAVPSPPSTAPIRPRISGGNVVALSSYSNDTYTSGSNTNITAANPAPLSVASNTLAFRQSGSNTLTLPSGTSTLGAGGI